MPGLGAAVAGTAMGGPLGGIAGFMGEGALGSIVPAYNAARARGLDPDAATKQAIIESGIAATFAGAMGLVGKFPLTGTAQKVINGEVADVLKRPLMEAMTQIGIVQPSLMAGQDVATGASRGELPSRDQLLTDMVVGGLAGLGIHENVPWAGEGKRVPPGAESRNLPRVRRALQQRRRPNALTCQASSDWLKEPNRLRRSEG